MEEEDDDARTHVARAVPAAIDRERAEMKRDISVTVFSGSGYDVPGSLTEFIAWAQAHLDGIPEEFRESAQIDINAEADGYGASWAEVRITYWRPETEEEEAARKREERSRQDAQRAQEMRQLAALEAKYRVKEPK